jgi:hypothetical protein
VLVHLPLVQEAVKHLVRLALLPRVQQRVQLRVVLGRLDRRSTLPVAPTAPTVSVALLRRLRSALTE